jgi:hypothetical protein
MAARALQRVFIVGNGMTKFSKPGQYVDVLVCVCVRVCPCMYV